MESRNRKIRSSPAACATPSSCPTLAAARLGFSLPPIARQVVRDKNADGLLRQVGREQDKSAQPYLSGQPWRNQIIMPRVDFCPYGPRGDSCGAVRLGRGFSTARRRRVRVMQRQTWLCLRNRQVGSPSSRTRWTHRGPQEGDNGRYPIRPAVLFLPTLEGPLTAILSAERRFACRRPRGDDVMAQARGRWGPYRERGRREPLEAQAKSRHLERRRGGTRGACRRLGVDRPSHCMAGIKTRLKSGCRSTRPVPLGGKRIQSGSLDGESTRSPLPQACRIPGRNNRCLLPAAWTVTPPQIHHCERWGLAAASSLFGCSYARAGAIPAGELSHPHYRASLSLWRCDMRFLTSVAVIAMAAIATWLNHRASVSPPPPQRGDVVEEAKDYFRPVTDWLW